MGIWSTKWPDGIKNGLLSDFWRWSVTNMPPESHVVWVTEHKVSVLKKWSELCSSFPAEGSLLRRAFYALSKRVYLIFPVFYPSQGKMHRLIGYTPHFGVSGLFRTLKNRTQKWISGHQKVKKTPFFRKKTSKMAILAFCHFGPQNDPKWPILDPKMTQNDRFWPILDPKMTKNDRFWTPKWLFSGFSRFWSKKGVLYMQKVAFWPFFDPFLAHFWAHFGP